MGVVIPAAGATAGAAYSEEHPDFLAEIGKAIPPDMLLSFVIGVCCVLFFLWYRFKEIRKK